MQLTESPISQRLDKRGISYKVHTHAPVRTMKDVQTTLPFPRSHMVKTLVLIANEQVILAVLSGASRLDYNKLAIATSTPRTKIKVADVDVLINRLGFQPGGASPVTATSDDANIIFDESIRNIDPVYCGFGRNDATLEISNSALRDIARPLFADIAQTNLQGSAGHDST